LAALFPLLAGLGPVIGILALNPINRVYSHHGLIHTSIIYRIFHTDLPPTHPFLGDQALPYYWGYHFLAAQLVSLGLAPSWAGVVINLVTLLGTMLAAWWIAKQFLRRASAGTRYWLILASAFGALFAPSYLPPGLLTDMVGVPLGLTFCDARALPAAVKFVNQSGMPLGILCTLTWLASLIGYYQGGRVWVFAGGLGLSLLACSFFYPPMLPSLVLGTPVVAVLFIWTSARPARAELWKRGILICLVGAGSVLLTFPYLLQVAESLRGNTKIFDLASGSEGLIWAALIALPTLGYLYLRRDAAREHLERVPMLVFTGVFISSIWLYLTLSQPLRTEYKYLSVAMIALGFVGGGMFGVAWCKRSVLSWVIAVAFLLTPTYSLVKKLNYHTDWKNKFEESGRDLLYTGDSQKAEVFNWVRTSSEPNALFLDPTGLVPIYGQRGALISPNVRGTIGFGGNPYEFLAVHDQELLDRRLQVLDGTASSEVALTTIPSGVPVYHIVDRREYQGAGVDRDLWRQVFKSKHMRYWIFSWVGDSKQD
jgi:hypothetical protein